MTFPSWWFDEIWKFHHGTLDAVCDNFAAASGRGSPFHSLGVKNEISMILEVATLNVRVGEGAAFEQAFSQAQNIISSMPGYVSHQLQRCLESQDKYLLLVQWQRLEDHTIGFRQSRQYQDWKKLLHHFYEPFPTVEHYEPVFAA
jgi:heme-degrading monooxygenase HmoA